MGRELNLGRYALRHPSKSQEIQVGTFFRKQKAKETENSGDFGHHAKRRAIEEDVTQITGSHIITGYSSNSGTTSFGSSLSETSVSCLAETSSVTTQIYEHNDDQYREQDLNSSSGIENSQRTSAGLMIDTQNISQATSVSHESLTINVNPMDYSVLNLGTCSKDPQDLSCANGIGSFSVANNSNLSFPNVKRKKIYPKKRPYERILSHVVFVMSGFENPRRAKLRDMAIAMGAQYSAKWNKKCTHLL